MFDYGTFDYVTFDASISSAASQALFSSLFTNTNSFFSSRLTLYLLPSLVTNNNTFYGEVLTPGIHPSLFINGNYIYPFIKITVNRNEPAREFKRYKYPYTSTESTRDTGTFRVKNTAFGPHKTSTTF